MYKLKEMAKRGTSLVAAVGLLSGIGASALPSLASADALNPLTERSLTLSSSSPGWSYVDGSGNSVYAPPNSGANGKKTGNFYTFRMSSNGVTVKGITFQYCTTPAGVCTAPGNNGYNLQGTPTTYTDDTRNPDSATTSDLNVTTGSGGGAPAQITSADWATIQARTSSYGTTSDLYAQTPDHDNTEGNFIVLTGDSSASETSATHYSGGAGNYWSMTAGNDETYNVAQHDPTLTPARNATDANNMITLTKTTGQTMDTGDYFKIAFYATDTNYITNPGQGAFFVRINTYSTDNPANFDETTLIDGGVTVANVMNESITIQTKVLETMDFSVGTHDPNTYPNTTLTAKGIPALGQCSSLLMADPTSSTYSTDPHNVLKLGDPAAEYSLKTSQDYTVDSYWRLSSNSSGGATVYYTGHTLTNTVGDQITPMNNTASGGTPSTPGTEQFGIGFVQDGTAGEYNVAGDNYGTDDGNNGTYNGTFLDFVTNGPGGTGLDADYAHLPRLAPLVPDDHYAHGGDGTPAYAFSSDADTYAQPIATESTEVVNCVTAKMRYVANIAATTPAGIYTTKVNYVASPQY